MIDMTGKQVTLTRRTFGAALSAAFLIKSGPPAAEQASPASTSTSWETSRPLPMPGSEFAAAVIERTIFVAGGFDVESRLFAFDSGTSEWMEWAALPQPRHHAGLAALDGYVYLAGGHDHESRAVDTFWRYDPGQDTWEELPPLP